MEWNVHEGTYDAATNLAIDDLMLEKAANTEEAYLRVYDFEDPAVILARNEHVEDINEFRETHDYTRRDTGGSVIYCDENAIFYSITIPAGNNDYPENLHREYFGPRIADALSDLGVNDSKLGVGEHFSVRINEGTVSGNSQRKKKGAVLYHGVLALEPWDVNELDQIIELREKESETERDFIDSLPGVFEHTDYSGQEGKELAKQLLIENFTGQDYHDYSLTDQDWKKIVNRAENRYLDEEWLQNAHGNQSLDRDQGFCFVDWTDEWSEEVDRYGFY